MKRNVIYTAAVWLSAAAVTACAAVLAAGIIGSGTGNTVVGSAMILSAAAFALGDIISAAACTLGRMKEKSAAYSIVRVFIFVYAFNMAEDHPYFAAAAAVSLIMYIISLKGAFREYAARNGRAEMKE